MDHKIHGSLSAVDSISRSIAMSVPPQCAFLVGEDRPLSKIFTGLNSALGHIIGSIRPWISRHFYSLPTYNQLPSIYNLTNAFYRIYEHYEIHLLVDGYILVSTIDNIDYDQITPSHIYGRPWRLSVFRKQKKVLLQITPSRIYNFTNALYQIYEHYEIYLPVDGYILIGCDKISPPGIYGWPRELSVYSKQ